MNDIEEIIDQVGTGYAKYSNPDVAAGYCNIVTAQVLDDLEWMGAQMIYTAHTNDPDWRYSELGQYADHFAVYIDGTVLDYTMRQFHPDTPFPYVGTVDDWTALLSAAWEQEDLPVSIGTPCNYCQLVKEACSCCHCGAEQRQDCVC